MLLPELAFVLVGERLARRLPRPSSSCVKPNYLIERLADITEGEVNAGTRYAIILIPGAPANGKMYWRGNSGASTYPKGSAYELNGATWVVPATGPKDHGFRLGGACH